jgi:hypothetical protein
MTTTIASLKRNDPLTPVPAGAYECWAMRTGLHIVNTGPRGVSGERAVTQVWPPVQPKEKQQ